ncbi:unnamed protein product [Agarophyton chilense]
MRVSPSPSSPPPPSDAAQTHRRMLHKATLIHARLQRVYPTPPSSFLTHSNAYTLLIAVVLSAQAQDVKVNEITPQLFRRANTPHAMVQLGERAIGQVIRPLGLAARKARSIVRLSAALCERHAGIVPNSLEQLERLDGVGRKTASVVLLQAFDTPAFPVDTHVHRLACRWGCGHATSVVETERRLKQWFPQQQSWAHLHTRMILFGREHCAARKHDMDACAICSFAATDEARMMNQRFPNKFVPASVHRDPYSVRLQPEGAAAEEEAAQGARSGASRRRRRRSGGTNGASATGAASAAAGGDGDGGDDGDDGHDEERATEVAAAKRAKIGRKRTSSRLALKRQSSQSSQQLRKNTKEQQPS